MGEGDISFALALTPEKVVPQGTKLEEENYKISVEKIKMEVFLLFHKPSSRRTYQFDHLVCRHRLNDKLIAIHEEHLSMMILTINHHSETSPIEMSHH